MDGDLGIETKYSGEDDVQECSHNGNHNMRMALVKAGEKFMHSIQSL